MGLGMYVILGRFAYVSVTMGYQLIRDAYPELALALTML